MSVERSLRNPFRSKFLAWTISVLTAVSGGLLTAPGTANAVTTSYPGGKRLWVLSVSSLTNGVVGTNTDFSRVGTYTFTLTGGATVKESFYYYAQSKLVGKQPSGVLGCASSTTTCPEYVPAGFENDPKTLNGTWAYDDSTHLLDISWTGGATEEWYVTNPASDVAAMTLSSASYLAAGHGYGFGYGSNYGWGSGVSVATMMASYAHLYPGFHCQGDYGIATSCLYDQDQNGNPTGINIADYTACNTACITAYKQRTNNPDYDRYYIANMPNDPRAIGREFYDVGTNAALCPADGSTIIKPHVEAIYEIIGDAGAFHGFVGIEASLYLTTGPDYLQIFHYTDIG